MINKFTLAAIYLTTITLFTTIDPNLLLCSLMLMAWCGMQEFVQLRGCVLFQDSVFLKYKSVSVEGNIGATSSDIMMQTKRILLPSAEYTSKDQWQLIMRSIFSCSFCVLAFCLNYTNNMLVPFAILATYSMLTVTIIVSLVLGTIVNCFDAGERDTIEQSYRKEDLLAIGIDFLGILWVGFTLSMVYNIACVSQGFALMFLLSCWLSDAGEYIMQKMYHGKIRFQTVSPNRTLEGLVFSIIICATFGYFFKSIFFIPFRILGNINSDLLISNNTAYFFSLVCGIIAMLSFLGDLTVSYVKRVARVRFSSDLFYDYGGVLDVFKGVCFSALPMFSLAQTLYI